MRRMAFLFAALWLAVSVVSVLFLVLTPATGTGFTRGFNRLEAFFGWQGVAIACAVFAFVAARSAPPPRPLAVALAGYGPAAISALVALVAFGLFTWAASQPQPPPAPAAEATPVGGAPAPTALPPLTSPVD